MAENVILGNLCPLGTGSFDLFLDTEVHMLAALASEIAMVLVLKPNRKQACRDAVYVHHDQGDEPITFADAAEQDNSMTPAHMASPANFQAPWSPGMQGNVTFSPMAPTSPDVNYGYQSPAYAPQSPGRGSSFSPQSPSYRLLAVSFIDLHILISFKSYAASA